MQEYFIKLGQQFIDALPNIFAALVILVLSFYLARILSRVLVRVLQRQQAAVSVSELLSQMLRWAIISFGIIAALQRFFNVTAFLTGLGILGFTVGFALQNIMQNFASGIILLIQQPFKVNDNVGIVGYDGTVLAIGLRTTELKTLDGRIIFLPNGDVLSQPILNYTRSNRRRVELPIGVAYDSNTDLVRKTILEEVKKVPGFVNEPEPQVIFHTFGASSIDLNVQFWVDTAINTPITGKDIALSKIKVAFEKKKIEIPYPIQVQYNKPLKQTRRKK